MFCQCHAEELYVRVATGEYFFGEDYIRSGHTDKDLFHELAHGTVVHEKEWLKRHPPKEEPYDEPEPEPEQPGVQADRTSLRHEGDMPVRQGGSAQGSAQAKQEQPEREVRHMLNLMLLLVGLVDIVGPSLKIYFEGFDLLSIFLMIIGTVYVITAIRTWRK